MAERSRYFEDTIAQERRFWQRHPEERHAAGALRDLEAQEGLYEAGLPPRVAMQLARQGYPTIERVLEVPPADLPYLRNLARAVAAIEAVRLAYRPVPAPDWVMEE